MYFLFGGGFGHRRGGGSRKPKKQPKENWFEELNATQCKELAKASKLKLSGPKKDLVQRLADHDFVGRFGGNKKAKRWMSGDMVTIDELKGECRKRLLQVTGTKYDLVLRIIQHEHGTGGDSLKRAATEITTDGNGNTTQVIKKRKPSKPSPSTFYTRVQKKIIAVDQKKYQSYYGAKAHAPDVCDLMSELLQSIEPHTGTDPKLVIDCCRSVVSSFVDNFGFFERAGYCEDLEGMADTIVDYANDVRSKVAQEELDDLAKTMIEWRDIIDPYGGFMDYDMEKTACIIRQGHEASTLDSTDSNKKTPAKNESELPTETAKEAS